jgi:transposase
LLRFSPERRSRFLGLLEGGRNVEEACAAVGVSRSTVSKWVARGRAGDGEAAAFAEAFDAIRAADSGRGEDRPLDEDDLVRLLERQARRGSVPAMKMLLERLDRQRRDDRPPSPWGDAFGPIDEVRALRERGHRR